MRRGVAAFDGALSRSIIFENETEGGKNSKKTIFAFHPPPPATNHAPPEKNRTYFFLCTTALAKLSRATLQAAP
jgi:hypothetical protein